MGLTLRLTNWRDKPTADKLFPLKQVKFHEINKPWITPYIRALVKKRQKAFHSRRVQEWKILRNKVKAEISKRK